MKYFVVADVHGYYDELIAALNKAGFDKDNSDHVLISLGDLVDRGAQAKECLEFVLGLPRAILIRGNHEDLMEEMLSRGYPVYVDYHNGTFETAKQLTLIENKYDAIRAMRSNDLWCEYEQRWNDYAEIGNYICVHGWIPFAEDWRNGSWSQARWFNGMEEWYAGIRVPGKTILCGHWHTSWGHSRIHNICHEFGNDAIFDPFIDDGIVALDACTTLTHQINVYTFED